jgi:hypothetical protein
MHSEEWRAASTELDAIEYCLSRETHSRATTAKCLVRAQGGVACSLSSHTLTKQHGNMMCGSAACIKREAALSMSSPWLRGAFTFPCAGCPLSGPRAPSGPFW